MDALGYCEPSTIDMAQGFLHMDKKSSSSLGGKLHGPQIDNYMLPLININPLLITGGGR